MKNIFLMLAAGIIFSLSSCNSGDVGTDETSDRIPYENEPQPKPDPEESDIPDNEQETAPPVYVANLDLIFTVDDIISYNITTREIVFTDLIVEKFTTPNDEGVYDRLILYYGDKPLFEDIKIYHARGKIICGTVA
ncbi:MAG: hypothetical protein LBJ47_00085 [Tannerella sp.]|jgi:hypothetical protein|nr:hypothetical protein [Tannerella sp.]